MNHKKPSKKLIESISQVVNEKLSTNNVSTNTLSNVAHMGDGTSLVDSPPPTKVGKIPVGKGKRVGLGWVSTPKDFKVITDIIKDAGIKIDDADDPRDVLKALNQAKYENQKKLADNLASKLSTSIGRPEDAISDVKQAIIQYDKAKAEFSKHTEKIADKIHKINKGVIEKRWKNPDLFNKDNASKYVAWDIKDTGEEHETEQATWWDPLGLWQYSPLNPKSPTYIPPIWDPDNPLRKVLKWQWDHSPVNPDGTWWQGMPDDDGAPTGGEQPDGDQQGQQAPTDRDARVDNVKKIIQNKEFANLGVFTPQSKNKNVKKSIKIAKEEHPEAGEPSFVILKGSKLYNQLLSRFSKGNGEHETARSTVPPWPHPLPMFFVHATKIGFIGIGLALCIYTEPKQDPGDPTNPTGPGAPDIIKNAPIQTWDAEPKSDVPPGDNPFNLNNYHGWIGMDGTSSIDFPSLFGN